MKTNNPKGDDRALDALLQEWRSASPLPPRFQEQVWRRIERTTTTPASTGTLWQLFETWLNTRLPRPALATAYLAALLLIGAGIGWTQARQDTVRINTELGVRYAQTVDPFQPGR